MFNSMLSPAPSRTSRPPQVKAVIGRLPPVTAAILAVSTAAASAGPCSSDIARVQARLDARLAAVAAAGRSAPESSSAKLHHQPTPGSIAAAEGALGELSPEQGKIIREGMARARAADKAGDRQACERALDEVQQTISR